jgi:2-methylcitrate dehydratase PrpD
MKQGGANVELTKGVASSVAAPLVEFVVSLGWEGLSESVRHEARRSFVNIVGTMIAGSRDHTVHKLLSALKPLMGPPRATVLGRAGLVDTLSAAFLNAVSGKVLDLADAHPATIIHPGATILASLLGLAESRRLSGSEVLTAFIAGSEIAFRLGRAFRPSHRDGESFITASYSEVGAAAAVGKLLGLDESKIRNAMGIATLQAGAHIDYLSGVAKCIAVGDTARNGLLAAHYAQAGIDAPATALEGSLGLLGSFMDAVNPAAATTKLGASWEILENRGSRPIGDQEITEKTIGLIEWAAPMLHAQPLVEALWNIDTVKDVQPLIARTVPSNSPTVVAMA